MSEQHRVHKYLFLLITCIFVISLLLPGCSGRGGEEEVAVTTEEEEEVVVTPEEEELVTQ